MFNKSAFDSYATEFTQEMIIKNQALPYWYTAQKTFQLNWDSSQIDTAEMIEAAFDVSTDLWSLPLIEAKHALLKFTEVNSDLLLAMFRDLYSENKSLDGRIDRFLFHCDLLLKEVNQQKILIPEHNHNKWVVSVYLSYQYPSQYLPFDYEMFSKGMLTMKAMKVPESYEIDRYFKICRIMTKFLIKIPEISDYYSEKQSLQIQENQLIAYDFLKFLFNQ
jgi:hypothetical protein